MMMAEAKVEETEIDYLRRENAELKHLLVLALKRDTSAIKQILNSLDVQNDRKLVLSLINDHSMLSYNKLPEKWKNDVKTVCSLLKPMSIKRTKKNNRVYKDGFEGVFDDTEKVWNELPYHLKVNEEVLSHALKSKFGPKWNQIHHKFHSNVSLMHIALEYGKLSFDKNIPNDLKYNNKDIASYGVRFHLIQAGDCWSCLDESFYKKVLEDDEIKWEWLPYNLQNDIEFASTISDFSKNSDLAEEILTKFIDFRDDKSFWRKIFQSKSKELIPGELMDKFAPIELFSDRNFILEMFQISDEFPTHLINENLFNDVSFLEVALKEDPLLLEFVPHDIQRLHRNLILETIAHTPPSDSVTFRFEQCLHLDFWTEPDFAKVWVSAGHGFPGDINIRYCWQQSRELCLKNAIERGSVRDVHRYKGEVSFMQEVLEHHPDLYFKARNEAKSDYMIMTTVFSACPKIAKEALTQFHFEGRDEEITNFLNFLRKELEPFEIFQKYVLGSMMSTQTIESTGTLFTLLNQGIETSLLYKKEIASYLGIPTGKRLRCLQHAEQNVRDVILEWST